METNIKRRPRQSHPQRDHVGFSTGSPVTTVAPAGQKGDVSSVGVSALRWNTTASPNDKVSSLKGGCKMTVTVKCTGSHAFACAVKADIRG